MLSAIYNYILTRLRNPDSTTWWPLRSDTLSVLAQSTWICPTHTDTRKHLKKHTHTDTNVSSQILSASCLSGIRHIPQLNQNMMCNGRDRGPPNGCHSKGLQLNVFPSPKGLVCVSGTNRQCIWHRHRNIALGMDAANEGRPSLSNPACQSLQSFFVASASSITCTQKTHTPACKQEPCVPSSLHSSPAPPTLYSLEDEMKDADIHLFSVAAFKGILRHSGKSAYLPYFKACYE